MIRRCAELHLEPIAASGDPFECGSSRPLDFGHWAAHRIEALTEHTVRHGEAVAIGMALDNRYAVLHGVLDEISEQRVLNLWRDIGRPESHSLLCSKSGQMALLQGLDEFR